MTVTKLLAAAVGLWGRRSPHRGQEVADGETHNHGLWGLGQRAARGSETPRPGWVPPEDGGQEGPSYGTVERLAKWSSSLEPPNIPQMHLGARLHLGQTARQSTRQLVLGLGCAPGERTLSGS